MSQVTERIQTRRENALKRPGLVDLQGKISRHSKAQKAEDDRALQKIREADERAAMEGLQRLAAMEVEMEEAAQGAAKKPAPVKPRPRQVKKQAVAPAPPADKKTASAGKSGGNRKHKLTDADPHEGAIVEDSEGGDFDYVDEGEVGKKAKKRTKMSLKDKVGEVRLMGQVGSTIQGARVEDQKGKSSVVL